MSFIFFQMENVPQQVDLDSRIGAKNGGSELRKLLPRQPLLVLHQRGLEPQGSHRQDPSPLGLGNDGLAQQGQFQGTFFDE